jgi:hypothetical protein
MESIEAALRQIIGSEHRTTDHSINFVNPYDPDTHISKLRGFGLFLRER